MFLKRSTETKERKKNQKTFNDSILVVVSTKATDNLDDLNYSSKRFVSGAKTGDQSTKTHERRKVWRETCQTSFVAVSHPRARIKRTLNEMDSKEI